MIQVKKRAEIPVTLKSEKVKRAQERLRQKVENGGKPNNKDGDFPSHWLDDDVRLKIWEDQNKKCCYCERLRDPKREADIEHFRPRAEVAEDPSHLGYWWLAYDWDNLLFSCRTCNQQYKKTYFPLRGGRRAEGPDDDLSQEEPFLLNPCEEDPEKYITFRWEFGRVPLAMPVTRDSEGRGCRTIEILGLDRDKLNTERGNILLSLNGIQVSMDAALNNPSVNQEYLDRQKDAIRNATMGDQAFAGLRRAYFRAVRLGDYIVTD